MFMVPLSTAAAFLAGNEAVCGLIALEVDSTLVAFSRQA
jgi:MFS superfamily sulfate permease-like transporter